MAWRDGCCLYPFPDASEPDVEIVIAGHGARVHEVCVVVKVQ